MSPGDGAVAAAQQTRTFAELFDAIADNVAQVIQGKDEVIELVAAVPGRRGPPADRGRARRRQDQPGQGAGRLDRLRVRPHPVHARPAAVRRGRRHRLRTAAPSRFEFRPGPVFANIVLADEINRASPKTQSALLEAMAERQVTVDGHDLPAGAAVPGDRHPEPDRARGHLPAAREPARPVPDADLDGLPEPRRRARHPRRPTPTTTCSSPSGPVVTAADVARPWPPPCRRVHVAPALAGLPRRPGRATRRHPRLALGMSPRATLASSGSPGPGPRPPAAPTSRPTTSRRWPCRCSPTASSSPPRPSCRASTAADALAEVLRVRPGPHRHGARLTRRADPARLAGRGRVGRPARRRPAARRSSSCSSLGAAGLGAGGHRARRRPPPAAAPRARSARSARRACTPAPPAGSSCGSPTTGRRRSPVLRLRDRGHRHRRRTACCSAASRRAPSVVAAYRLPTERRGIVAHRPARGRGRRSRSAWSRRRIAGRRHRRAHRAAARGRRSLPLPSRCGDDPLAGAEQPNHLGRTGEDFYALRPYVVGDDLRRVHWPSTARTDELHGPPGRAAVAGPGHRAARRAPHHHRPGRLRAHGRRPRPASSPPSGRRGDLVRLVTTGGHRHRVRRRATPSSRR